MAIAVVLQDHAGKKVRAQISGYGITGVYTVIGTVKGWPDTTENGFCIAEDDTNPTMNHSYPNDRLLNVEFL